MAEIRFRVRDGILYGEYENGVVADFGDYREPRKVVLAPIPGVINDMQVCEITDEMWDELQNAYERASHPN